jgi:hypothetical protein
MYRTTADEVRLALWSDGAVTHGRSGAYLRGYGVCRSHYARRARAAAVRLLADDVALFTAAELPLVLKVAQSTYRYTYTNDTDRRLHVRSIARQKMRALENKVC